MKYEIKKDKLYIDGVLNCTLGDNLAFSFDGNRLIVWGKKIFKITGSDSVKKNNIWLKK